MLYTIQNEFLKATVSLYGAELQSLIAADGTEFLWQGDPAYWNERSPILFPYIGRMTNKSFYLDGELHHMQNHGIVKYHDFRLVSATDTQLVLAFEILKREHDVFTHCQVRIKGIVLEDHGDISVLRCYIVNSDVIDIEIASCDVFKSCNHSQCCGLSASGRTYQYDEFFVGDVEIEVLNSVDTFLSNLEVYDLLGSIIVLFLGLVSLCFCVRINLLDVFQTDC